MINSQRSQELLYLVCNSEFAAAGVAEKIDNCVRNIHDETVLECIKVFWVGPREEPPLWATIAYNVACTHEPAACPPKRRVTHRSFSEGGQPRRWKQVAAKARMRRSRGCSCYRKCQPQSASFPVSSAGSGLN